MKDGNRTIPRKTLETDWVPQKPSPLTIMETGGATSDRHTRLTHQGVRDGIFPASSPFVLRTPCNRIKPRWWGKYRSLMAWGLVLGNLFLISLLFQKVLIERCRKTGTREIFSAWPSSFLYSLVVQACESLASLDNSLNRKWYFHPPVFRVLGFKNYLLSQITKRGLFFQDNYYIKQLVKGQIAVITVEPADKIAFVYNCIQTRRRGQYNGKWLISLAGVSRPLVTNNSYYSRKRRRSRRFNSSVSPPSELFALTKV